jgi:hypothetical protein
MVAGSQRRRQMQRRRHAALAAELLDDLAELLEVEGADEVLHALLAAPWSYYDKASHLRA